MQRGPLWEASSFLSFETEISQGCKLISMLPRAIGLCNNDQYTNSVYPISFVSCSDLLDSRDVVSSQKLKGSRRRRGVVVATWAHILVIVSSSHMRGIYLYVFRFISAPLCRVPCPDGIKLQSLGNVRNFRNWCRELRKWLLQRPALDSWAIIEKVM